MKGFIHLSFVCGHFIILANGLSILTGSPQQAVLGENVNITLKCVVDVDNTVVTWKKEEQTVGDIQIGSSGKCTGMPSNTPYIFQCDQSSRIYYIINQIRNLLESEQNVTWTCRRLFDTTTSDPWSISIAVPVTTVTITPAGINNVVNIVVGDTQTFNCSTGLSRPAARIQWYIGGENVTNQAQPQTPQPDSDKFISSSRLIYTGKDENHNKNIYCEAGNIDGRYKVKSTEITINVELPVTTVRITPAGINNVVNVLVGDTQTFSCSTGLSRPAAWIQWYIGRENVTNQAQPQTPQQDGDKFISSSRLVYTGEDEDHNKTIFCETVNIEGQEKVKSREKSIYIQIPVTTVTITPAGINNVVNVLVGATRTFNCSTGLSRPAAWIQWYIGGENVTNQAQPQTPQQDSDKFISSSRLVYTGKDENHNKTIYCETVNIDGRNKVESTKIYFFILVPVRKVTITPNGNNGMTNVVEGFNQTFNCTTNSSRPAALIQWYIGVRNVTDKAQFQISQADGNKYRSSSSLVYNGNNSDHNNTIYCEAMNIAGKYSVISEMYSIYIQFGPKDISLQPTEKSFTITETYSLGINCSATCRPDCNFTWTGPGGYTRHQPQLYLTSVFRNQSGLYSCDARNSFGSNISTEISITVNYQPNIVQLRSSNGNYIDENTSVTLNCKIDSHPLSDVSWLFTKNNSLLSTSLNAQQSNYTIQTADCFRTGTYQCIARNRIDNSVMTDNKSIDIYVNCSPRSDVRKQMEDSIIGIDDNGILNITVYLIAFPQPNITWTFQNTETRRNVSVASNNTFSIIAHISTIQDLQIDKTDYGIYTIHASNNIGEEYIQSFEIVPQRKPDPPTNLSVECDIIAMTVTWRSEFDGGDTQIFNVQWSNLNTNTTITSNAIQNEGEGVYHIFTTELLLPSSLYIVIIKASNTHATVVSEELNCTTNALPKKGKSESATFGIIGGILGFVCALLVVTGMLIILRRRRRQKEDKEPIKGSKDSEVEQNDDDGLKENPLYVTSGQTKDNDNGPLYSEVNKPKKGPPVEIKDENAIYSQVEKTVKKGKQKKKEKNTRKEWENGIQDKGIELGSVYENSEKLMKTHSPEENANTYGNSGDVSTNGQGYNVTRNKDGLIYADLDLKPDANGRRFIIRGIENRNNYAILDLTKTAEPLPSDDSDDEKQISELTEDNGNTK